MKRRFQIEVEGGDGAVVELSAVAIQAAVRKLLPQGSGVTVRSIELRSAEIRSPIRTSEASPVEPVHTPGDARYCDTVKLLELIRLDPICEPYRMSQNFDPEGRHILIMDKAGINVEESRGILTHRVEVMAKLSGQIKPYRFMLELPGNRWEKLAKVK